MGTEPATKAVEEKSTGLWGLVAANTAVIGAGLYLAGWVYLYNLLRAFNVDIGLLDLSWHDILVHSAVLLNVVGKQLLSGPNWVITLITIPAALAFLERNDWYGLDLGSLLGRVNLHYYLPTLFSIAAIYWLVSLAQSTGIDRAERFRVSRGNQVHLIFKSAKEGCKIDESELISRLNKDEAFRIAISTAKWHVLMAQNGTFTPDGKGIDAVTVVQVPIDCVLAVESTVAPTKEAWR